MSRVFDNFYREQWGKRWDTLGPALARDPRYIAHINPYADTLVNSQFGESDRMKLSEQVTLCRLVEARVPIRDKNGLCGFYPMDLASVFPVLALKLHPNDNVLDLCAAPGGKALLLSQLLGEKGHLLLNDSSKNRFHRLKRVLADYLPPGKLQQIDVSLRDGIQFGRSHVGKFDKILVDAPCSGERHLLRTPSELSKWSVARSKNLSVRQYRLLASAWQALIPGGQIVYSTCSVSNLENDRVIEKLCHKKKGGVSIVEQSWQLGEVTKLGWQILPDQAENWGPIYFSVLEKKS